ncbi:MAG: CCA tRNA nucleotidyltransferase [Epsilonproteobacteria bacterium]|nr:CCA tRNA nucleotidyltransferase [Campylobacterota bacterium]
MQDIIYPIVLDEIFDKLKKNNIKSLIVGGYVRDFLLKIDSKDIDIELYNTKDYRQIIEIVQEFGKVLQVGKSFGVVKLILDDLDIDFTLPRVENKIAAGHKGFDIKIVPNLDYASAAKRRDFTINAIGYDVTKRSYIDPFDGIKDLQNKILRQIDTQTFKEDPLRVFRALQFSARFDLSIDKQLFVICSEMVRKGEMQTLPKERIYTEIEKLLIKARHPSKGFVLLKEMGLFHLFKELQQIDTKRYNNTIYLLDNLELNEKRSDIKASVSAMLATLIAPLENDAKVSFLKKLSDDKKLLNNIITLHSYLQQPSYALAMKLDIDTFRLYLKIHKVKNITYLCNAIAPKIDGKYLIKMGKKPSKEFSKILDQHYQQQIEKIKNLLKIQSLMYL